MSANMFEAPSRDVIETISPPPLAEAEPVHGPGGKVDERARRGRRRVGTDAEVDPSLDHVEGLVPGMAVRRWTAAFGAALKEHLVALGRLPRGEHGHVLAEDVEGRRVVLRGDDERLCGHLGGSSGKAIARVRLAGANPRPLVILSSRGDASGRTCAKASGSSATGREP